LTEDICLAIDQLPKKKQTEKELVLGVVLHKDSPHFVVLKYASITGTFWPVVFRQVKP
jgi:hypothetical protein